MGKYTKAVTFLLTIVILAPSLQAHAEEEDSDSRHKVRSNIVGIVADAQGHPIKNAKITVLEPDNLEIVGRAMTNEKGEYVIECLDPRKYHLALSALPERFLGQTVVINLGKDGQIVQWAANTETPAIATTRAGGGVCGCGGAWLSQKDDKDRRTLNRSNIIGKVVDAQGNPIENVKVTVLDPDNQEIVARRSTDDKGHYVVECLDQHKYTLAVGALPERFVTQNVVVNLGQNGLDVQWAANMEAPDIDTAKTGSGVCSCAAGWLGDSSEAGASLSAGIGGTPGTVGIVGGVVGGGVSLGLLLTDDDDGSGEQPPSPASPSR